MSNSKYNNRHVKADGYTFDSQAEYNRYCELKLLEKNSDIDMLAVHPRVKILEMFVYRGKKIRDIIYEADFGYVEGDKYILEDAKGVQTAFFKLKLKMLFYYLKDKPDIEFRMVEV